MSRIILLSWEIKISCAAEKELQPLTLQPRPLGHGAVGNKTTKPIKPSQSQPFPETEPKALPPYGITRFVCYSGSTPKRHMVLSP